MSSVRVSGAVVALCGVIVGCTAIDLDRLVVTTVTSETPVGAKNCVELFGQGAHFQAAAAASFEQTGAAVDRTRRALPPPLRSDRVVDSVFASITDTSAQSLQAASSIASFTAAAPAQPPAPVGRRPLPTLTEHDFRGFAARVTEHVLRQTSAPATGDPATDGFWDRLRGYYTAYYDGEFVNYFGQKLEKPKRSLTVSNEDIANATVVFIELLFDESLKTPVWVNGKKYYPGGTDAMPTVAKLKYRKPTEIAGGTRGCGINVPKANTIKYLAHTFSTAATTESALAVNSFGGIELGFGMLGKINIGDNQTLTTLIQASVSEIVGRLTVELAHPILANLDFGDLPIGGSSPSDMAPALVARSPALSRASSVGRMSAPFISANAR